MGRYCLHVRANGHRTGALAEQVLIRVEIIHRAVLGIANLGAARVLAVHAVVVIDEMAGATLAFELK